MSDHFLVAHRDAEALAKFAQFLFVQLFLLMRDVLALARLTQAVALDGLGKDDRRRALVFHRRLVGRVNFARVVAAAQQFANLLVGQMVHEFQQLRIFAEEMFARVAARVRRNISGNRRPPLRPCV